MADDEIILVVLECHRGGAHKTRLGRRCKMPTFQFSVYLPMEVKTLSLRY